MEILFELEDLSYVCVIFNVVVLVSAKKIEKVDPGSTLQTDGR